MVRFQKEFVLITNAVISVILARKEKEYLRINEFFDRKMNEPEKNYVSMK